MPALLKTAMLSGYHFQISFPVVASSAYVFPSPVVTYMRLPITTGNDCSPSRAIGSSERKFTVNTRPSLIDVARVDQRQRRVALVVRRVAPALPADVTARA